MRISPPIDGFLKHRPGAYCVYTPVGYTRAIRDAKSYYRTGGSASGNYGTGSFSSSSSGRKNKKSKHEHPHRFAERFCSPVVAKYDINSYVKLKAMNLAGTGVRGSKSVTWDGNLSASSTIFGCFVSYICGALPTRPHNNKVKYVRIYDIAN